MFGSKHIFFCAFGVAAAIAAVAEESRALTDPEVWNEGVEYYRAGDATNALRVLRPMMLSRSHGARAAEVVAKLEYESGNIEEAAAAAQVALRANPVDDRANRNFTRAVDGLPAMREARHVDEVLKAAQGKDPGSLMLAATYDARGMMDAFGGCMTNTPPRVIELSDELSARARKLSDVWLPVKEAICQAVTNEDQAATIVMQVDQAREKSRLAARQFEDLEPEGYATISDVEHDCTRFLKMTAMPPAAIGEDLVAQSNAWQDVESFNGRSWQQDALDFTRAFRAKFPAWARAYEQQAQSDTNRPPFTAEDQAKISALATELEKLQMECVESPLPPSQEKALELIREIRELLPKDGGGGQGQQGQQGRQSGQPQQNQQPQENQQPQDDGESGQDDQPQEEDAPQDGEGEVQEEESQEDKEVDAILRRAQERSDEHEADKKARMRKAPLPPNERDW
jgi:hypothetical protein